ncbi:MAG: hypothetical protein FWG42_03625 [Clostridiales bacterium]|nr:hypothetical protein [Clostridiales bacterium]
MKKRILLVLLSVVLVVGLMPTATFASMSASAANAIPKDAQTCADIGILKGEDAGVTEEYLNLATVRYQLVVILARLTGIEDQIDEADPGAPSFADAAGQSEYVRKVMVFAKNNPQLGFIGFEDGTFRPQEQATTQQLYKVFLVILGYTEGSDFTWGQVFSKAEQSGMTRLANFGNITNTNLATGLCEILRAKMQDGSGTLAASLSENGVLSQDAVEKSGVLKSDYFAAQITEGETPLAPTPTSTGGSGGGGGGGGYTVNHKIQDAFIETTARSELVYSRYGYGTMYYEDMTWEDYLFNVFAVLYGKGYDTPETKPYPTPPNTYGPTPLELGYEGNDDYLWLTKYADNMFLLKPDKDSVSLTLEIDDWQALEATYYFNDDDKGSAKTPGNMDYNVKLEVKKVGKDLIAGEAAPTVNQNRIGYYTYAKYLNMKNKRTLNPAIPRMLGDVEQQSNEEVFTSLDYDTGETDWIHYNYTYTWEQFMWYTALMKSKHYKVIQDIEDLAFGDEADEDIPEFLQNYYDDHPGNWRISDAFGEDVPDTVTLYVYKDYWQLTKITYYFSGKQVSPGGNKYKMTLEVLWMSEDNRTGVGGQSADVAVFPPYGTIGTHRSQNQTNALADVLWVESIVDNQPFEFQDAFIETTARSELAYDSYGYGTMYYEDMTWEDYLFNVFAVLYGKGYDTPETKPYPTPPNTRSPTPLELGYEGNADYLWLTKYADNMYLLKPGKDSVTLSLAIDDWQTLEATYYFNDNDKASAKTPGDMDYNVKLEAKILGRDLIVGKAAPTVDQNRIGYYTYAKYLNMKNKRTVNPAIPRMLGDVEQQSNEEIFTSLDYATGETDWIHYNYTYTWEQFMWYTALMKSKHYKVIQDIEDLAFGDEADEDIPEFLQNYYDDHPGNWRISDAFGEDIPDTVTLYVYKDYWQLTKITYYFSGKKLSPDGNKYKMTLEVLWMSEENRTGVGGQSADVTVFPPYETIGTHRSQNQANALADMVLAESIVDGDARQ